MTHARQQLRDAVGTAVSGLTTTGANVYTGRVYPLQSDELPCLWVNTVAEDAEAQTIDFDAVLLRTVTVEIRGQARAVSDIADVLDNIAEEVETALAGTVSVGGKSVALEYAGAQIDFSGDIDQPVGTVAMRWTAQLFTLASAPGTLVQV